MVLHAYAKINLGLRILRKRDDSFHDIETIFHRVDIADRLELGPSPDVTFSAEGLPIPGDQPDLCLRAARLLQKASGTRSGVALKLTKRIPVGAGLGGGSSDAAATLTGLNRFWNLEFTHDHLSQIGAELGSDVPYFLRPGSALATGRGEVLSYFPLDLPFSVLVVWPGIHIATAWAYAQCTPGGTGRATGLKSALLAAIRDPDRMQEAVVNEFEPSLFPKYPELARVRHELKATGAFYSGMSGSGSSLFGLYTDAQTASGAAQLFASRYKVYLTPPHFSPPAD